MGMGGIWVEGDEMAFFGGFSLGGVQGGGFFFLCFVAFLKGVDFQLILTRPLSVMLYHT